MDRANPGSICDACKTSSLRPLIISSGQGTWITLFIVNRTRLLGYRIIGRGLPKLSAPRALRLGFTSPLRLASPRLPSGRQAPRILFRRPHGPGKTLLNALSNWKRRRRGCHSALPGTNSPRRSCTAGEIVAMAGNLRALVSTRTTVFTAHG